LPVATATESQRNPLVLGREYAHSHERAREETFDAFPFVSLAIVRLFSHSFNFDSGSRRRASVLSVLFTLLLLSTKVPRQCVRFVVAGCFPWKAFWITLPRMDVVVAGTLRMQDRMVPTYPVYPPRTNPNDSSVIKLQPLGCCTPHINSLNKRVLSSSMSSFRKVQRILRISDQKPFRGSPNVNIRSDLISEYQMRSLT
jgi:hypothetical protein